MSTECTWNKLKFGSQWSSTKYRYNEQLKRGCALCSASGSGPLCVYVTRLIVIFEWLWIWFMTCEPQPLTTLCGRNLGPLSGKYSLKMGIKKEACSGYIEHRHKDTKYSESLMVGTENLHTHQHNSKLCVSACMCVYLHWLIFIQTNNEGNQQKSKAAQKNIWRELNGTQPSRPTVHSVEYGAKYYYMYVPVSWSALSVLLLFPISIFSSRSTLKNANESLTVPIIVSLVVISRCHWFPHCIDEQESK